jgi:predicted secreted hydrolase
MWRWLVLAGIGLAIVIGGFSLLDSSGNGAASASAVLPATAQDISGFDRAIGPWDWQFPADYAAHEGFQTEWWYYTGNLQAEDGRHFGFQFTVFRRAITPPDDASGDAGGSEWRSNQLYMAHFAVSDIDGERFFHEERFSRGGAGLAGATCEPLCRVWLEDWEVIALDPDSLTTRLDADGGDFALNLTLQQIKPPALQGDDGLSAKSEEIGNASYYYSLTRLPAQGSVRVGDDTFTVTGYAWKDHEFSTSALGSNALGWDWFGLHLDDNREIMVGQIRLTDGGRDPYFGGILVSPDGTTEYLPAESFTITPTGETWLSPHTGAEYPAGWEIRIQPQGDPITLTVTPMLADQELHGGGIAYWEGAVRITGSATGFGYAELTGYVDAMTGRF